MLAIIDYGMGNLHSVQKALEYIGTRAEITSDAKIIEKADQVILPGVGAYRDCSTMLKKSGMDIVTYNTIEQGKPLLGICVGMQLLFSNSEEGGFYEGLNLFDDTVSRLKTTKNKIPHMGWNQVSVVGDCQLLAGLDGENFYFVHSYAAHNIEAAWVKGITGYDIPFVSCIQKGNTVATQFHPEKSGEAGLQLLKNFLQLG